MVKRGGSWERERKCALKVLTEDVGLPRHLEMTNLTGSKIETEAQVVDNTASIHDHI